MRANWYFATTPAEHLTDRPSDEIVGHAVRRGTTSAGAAQAVARGVVGFESTVSVFSVVLSAG